MLYLGGLRTAKCIKGLLSVLPGSVFKAPSLKGAFLLLEGFVFEELSTIRILLIFFDVAGDSIMC